MLRLDLFEHYELAAMELAHTSSIIIVIIIIIIIIIIILVILLFILLLLILLTDIFTLGKELYWNFTVNQQKFLVTTFRLWHWSLLQINEEEQDNKLP